MLFTRSADHTHGTSYNKSGARTLACFALVASLFVAISAAAGADADISCSIEKTSGGLLLTWTEVPDAAMYQYKLEVQGQGNKYQRVEGNRATIELPEGVKGTLSLAPIFSDGSTQPRVKCGSERPTDFHCAVVGVDGGIFLSWSPVEGAVSYQYRISMNGVNDFGDLTGDSAFIDTPIRTNAEIGITPVMADGSRPARTNCGVAGSTTNPEPVDGSRICSVVPASGGVDIVWSEVPGAVKYQYKLEQPGQGNQYQRIEGGLVFAEAPTGTEVTVGVNPIFSDGSTLPRVPCGTAIAG